MVWPGVFRQQVPALGWCKRWECMQGHPLNLFEGPPLVLGGPSAGCRRHLSGGRPWLQVQASHMDTKAIVLGMCFYSVALDLCS